MKIRMLFRHCRLIGLLLAVLLGLLACAPAQTEMVPTQTEIRPNQTEIVRIGVYDSRAIAVAWAGTPSFNDWMGALQADYQKAREAGDQKKVQELELEGEARQKRLHLQAFSTEPVDDILIYIQDSLPAIQESAGVTMLLSKWDQATLSEYPSAELVDVTMALVDALHPNERQRQSAIQIQEREPVPLEEAEKIKDW